MVLRRQTNRRRRRQTVTSTNKRAHPPPMYIYREYFSKIPNWFSFVNTTVDAERMERSTNESLLFKNVLKDNKKQYLKGLRTIYGHFLYSSRSFLPTFFQNKTHKRMFKQKFFFGNSPFFYKTLVHWQLL